MGRATVIFLKPYNDGHAVEQVDEIVSDALRELFPTYIEVQHCIYARPLGYHMEYTIEVHEQSFEYLRNTLLDNDQMFYPYFYHIIRFDPDVD